MWIFAGILDSESLSMYHWRTPHIDVSQAAEATADSEAYREPSVVHSSFGRLRVHLPHWSGARSDDLAAQVHRLPGVVRAEANPRTGNLLILFEPRQTSVQALLDALPALRLDAPLSPPALPEELDLPIAVAGQALELQPGGTIVYMTGTGRVVYRTLGWSSVGMAVFGAITPGIPTTPFVILAGYFFMRSSPEAHEWLRQSRGFGPILRDWEAHRGIRRWLRNATLALIGGSMVLTALMGLPTPLTVTILTLQVIGIAIVLRLRVIESDQ
jgi:uncharacterized membrane protein YbaN (DUF454 family)